MTTTWEYQQLTYENLYLLIGEGFSLLIDSDDYFLIEDSSTANTQWTYQTKN